MPYEGPRNPISHISEKDYCDYEFIAKDFQEFAGLSPEDQLKRFSADPWSAFSGLRGTAGFLPLSREARSRFTQIAARGLQPFLSVIISTRNRKERLRRCLSSLTAQGYPRDRWELIVVEDGDQKPLDEVMLSLRDRLPLRWFRVSHAGCGGAKNAGASQARGHYLVFTDDDCLFCPDWLSRYEKHFERAGHCLVAGCAVNPRKANPYSDASQELVNYLLDRSNAPPHEATLAIGNNFGVPAQGFRELGGFNPSYFPMGAEDRDFAACWVAAGWRIVYAPDIVVEHAQVLTFGPCSDSSITTAAARSSSTGWRPGDGEAGPGCRPLRFISRCSFCLGRLAPADEPH